MKGMFDKVLVANRGEIAVRVIRTLREMGIGSVAVYSSADRGALHVRLADEAVPIGPAPSAQSYLVVDNILEACRRTGARAVHPGYGFLSENPSLPAACEAAGVTFIGPDADAMVAMGNKTAARARMVAAGVPVVPGAEAGSADDLAAAAQRLGYPVMLKAAAGGGGKGMRFVERPDELRAAYERARSEAQSAFGDDAVYVEKAIVKPRHVEIQVLADRHGSTVHLFERDCSIQRRHQKVLEESPSPALGPELRQRLCADAVRLARAAGYENAGTAEFLVAEGELWFIELNARLQVEHPVTELVTGVDLVEQQLRVAAGERVDTVPTGAGHAVEVRLYAEHPLTFLPQAGVVERLALPDGIRVDAGVEAGDPVPVAYDPLIAKLVAHAPTRDEAFERLSGALRATRVGGVTTNLPFLRWLVDHPEARAGRTTTAFLAEHPPLSRRRTAGEPWARYWRLNRDRREAPPARRPPPVLEIAAHVSDGPVERSILKAPMPGTVIRVLAVEGDRVEPRQPLVILEAMKMETPLVSPYEAVVRRVHVAEGDQVAGGAVLVELEE